MAQASIDEEKGTVLRFSGARARTSALDAYNRPMQEGTAEPGKRPRTPWPSIPTKWRCGC